MGTDTEHDAREGSREDTTGSARYSRRFTRQVRWQERAALLAPDHSGVYRASAGPEGQGDQRLAHLLRIAADLCPGCAILGPLEMHP